MSRACCSPAPVVLEIHLVATIAGVQISVKSPQGIYSTKSSILPEARVDRVLPAEIEAAKIANVSSMLAFTATCNHQEEQVLHS